MITATKKTRVLPSIIVSVLIFAVFLVFIVKMLDNTDEVSRKEALQTVTDTIIRAVVSCYAYEGAYPDDLEYLKRNYNLILNHERYFIFYDKIGDNLMPTIVVQERNTLDEE